MLIRRGTPADIPDLMALERQSPAAAHWSREQYRTAFSAEAPSRVLLVLEEDGAIQGFIAGIALDKEWEIENVVVAESVRRCGFGTKLTARVSRVSARQRRRENISGSPRVELGGATAVRKIVFF